MRGGGHGKIGSVSPITLYLESPTITLASDQSKNKLLSSLLLFYAIVSITVIVIFFIHYGQGMVLPTCWAAPCGPASPVLAQPQVQRKRPESATETSVV